MFVFCFYFHHIKSSQNYYYLVYHHQVKTKAYKCVCVVSVALIMQKGNVKELTLLHKKVLPIVITANALRCNALPPTYITIYKRDLEFQ